MDAFEKEFEELERLREQMHKFVQHVTRLTSVPAQFISGAWLPAVDVYETDGGYLVVFELPGVDPQSLKVVVEADSVTVSGEKKIRLLEGMKAHRAHQLEIASGPFQRSVQLPGLPASDSAKATYRYGLLYVTFPKSTSRRVRKNVPVEEE